MERGAIQLTVTAVCGSMFVPYLRRHLRAAHKLVKKAPRELSFALVSDATMAELHQQFMGINMPTDVLTFELEHGSRGRVTGGEVVICVPQARRQAKTNTEEELLLCAIHGMLHLSGFDDKTGPEFTAMHRAEDRILSRLGVGKVFNR
jgi:probable rRNA maturation factor